jgi:2,3-bisphosphoglycerate-independent phosphoglycerate mutase
VTADHGNAEKMRDADGSPFTAHTTNPVPFIAVGETMKGKPLAAGGALKDIAPTVLALLGLDAPAEMEGRNLLG